jgi:hypothetical protein
MAFCGPATVALTVGRKTYAFHNGFCAEPIPNSDAFQLSVGTDVPSLGGPNDNAGQPVFSMDFAKAHTTRVDRGRLLRRPRNPRQHQDHPYRSDSHQRIIHRQIQGHSVHRHVELPQGGVQELTGTLR